MFQSCFILKSFALSSKIYSWSLVRFVLKLYKDNTWSILYFVFQHFPPCSIVGSVLKNVVFTLFTFSFSLFTA